MLAATLVWLETSIQKTRVGNNTETIMFFLNIENQIVMTNWHCLWKPVFIVDRWSILTFHKTSCLVFVGEIILRNVDSVCTIFPLHLCLSTASDMAIVAIALVDFLFWCSRNCYCCCYLLLMLACEFMIFLFAQVAKGDSGSAVNAAESMAIPTFLVYSRSRLKTERNFTSSGFCPCVSLVTCTMIWSKPPSTDRLSGQQRFPGMSWPREAYLFHRKLK